MKNFIKSTVVFGLLLAAVSCTTNDTDPKVSANGFTMRVDPLIVAPSVLVDADSNINYAKLSWDRCDNGVATESTYSVLISDHDSDPNHLNGIEFILGNDPTPDSRTSTIKIGQFNQVLNQLPTFRCTPMNIDIRIKSKLGISSNALYQYSNPITVAVTGFSLAQPILAVVNGTNSPASSPILKASLYSNISDYEGYMYLDAGTYKLYQPDPCGDFSAATVYGFTGPGNAGALDVSGATGYTVATAGYYLIKVNRSSAINSTTTIPALSYKIAPISTFALSGTGTGQPAFINSPMTYDSTAKQWKLTIVLSKGKKFKFKALNGTSLVLTLGGAATNLVENGTDISVPGLIDDVPSTQKYDVVLDVSNPKNTPIL